MQIQNKRSWTSGFLVIMFCLLLIFIGLMPTTVKAETNDIQENSQVQQVIDNTLFITFKKVDSDEANKKVSIGVYIPDEFFVDSFQYGAIIGPSAYLDEYIKENDYIREFEEQGVSITNILATEIMSISDGRVFEMGVENISDSEIDMEMFYIFYASDMQGEIEYLKPMIASFNDICAENYSNEELEEMVNQKIRMHDSGKMIMYKLSELVDAVWIYLILGCSVAVTLWGGYIGLRIIIAKNKEEKIDARNMVKSLVIGIITIFVIAMAAPLLIKGLSAWLG